MVTSGSGDDPVAGSCKRSNEPSFFLNQVIYILTGWVTFKFSVRPCNMKLDFAWTLRHHSIQGTLSSPWPDSKLHLKWRGQFSNCRIYFWWAGKGTGWTTEIRFPVGTEKGIFLYATTSRPALGPTQPPAQRVPAALSPGEKRPPCVVEVKNVWSCTHTPLIRFLFVQWQH
jgi:hypothetical protein